MEPTNDPAVKPPAPEPSSPAPVMDVRPPQEPVAVKPAPPDEEGHENKGPDHENHKQPAKNEAKKSVAAKGPKNGVGMAIFATVVIILGLAALATYAFLQTQN